MCRRRGRTRAPCRSASSVPGQAAYPPPPSPPSETTLSAHQKPRTAPAIILRLLVFFSSQRPHLQKVVVGGVVAAADPAALRRIRHHAVLGVARLGPDNDAQSTTAGMTLAEKPPIRSLTSPPDRIALPSPKMRQQIPTQTCDGTWENDHVVKEQGCHRHRREQRDRSGDCFGTGPVGCEHRHRLCSSSRGDRGA